MNRRVLITYTSPDGLIKGELSEYYMNSASAYSAAEILTKKLRLEGKIITSIKFLPVIKHLELAPVLPLSQSLKAYGEVK